MNLAADLARILADASFGESVVCAGVTTRGVFTRGTMEALDVETGASVARLRTTVEVPAAAFPAGVAPDLPITVGGRPYQTRDVEVVAGGHALVIHLAGSGA